MKLCLKCKKEFKSHKFKPTQQFCSVKCQQSYWYFRMKKVSIIQKCLFCKKEFVPNRIDMKYCTKKCRVKEEWRKLKRIPQKKRCEVCKKEFVDKIKIQKYCSIKCQKIVHKQISRDFMKKKRKIDINYKLRHNISTRIILALKKNKNYVKKNKTIKLLGCSILELRKHLESKFKKGMTWKNYGDWEIDHIIPCASFNLKEEFEQMKCFNYNNLQPLWRKENNIKSNKLIPY